MPTFVTRGREVLLREGSVPEHHELDFITIMESFEYDGVTVVTSSTGSAPTDDGWEWIPIVDVPDRVGDVGLKLGEGLLCHGA